MGALQPILYVDDEEHNLTVFEAAFEDYYDVHTATSARQAIDILRSDDVHLVIADQRMPEMTGVQLLEVVVREFPDIVRMILTGFVDVDAIIQAINAGRIYQYVTKPWDEKELRVVIDRALESYELKLGNRRLMEQLEQRTARETEIRKVFQRYVPATVIDDVLDAQTGDLSYGEERIVAVLACDIHGFTRLSEGLEPPQVIDFLNRYFAVMTDVVSRHRGTVDKLLGDGIVAVFGAPVSSINNAENAVRAALEMVAALADFNRSDAFALVGEEVEIGIGIHLGEVVAGNIGSDERMEYTVVGEAVQVAAEIEKLTRDVPDSILISQSVFEWTEDLIEVEALEPVEMGGRVEALQVFRVVTGND